MLSTMASATLYVMNVLLSRRVHVDDHAAPDLAPHEPCGCIDRLRQRELGRNVFQERSVQIARQPLPGRDTVCLWPHHAVDADEAHTAQDEWRNRRRQVEP